MFGPFRRRPSVSSTQPFSPQETETQLERLCDLRLVEQVKHQSGRGEIPDKHIKAISTYLDVLDKHYGRSAEMRWGSRPRLYAILHIIRGLKFMDPLIKQGGTDYSLPYTDYSLQLNPPTSEGPPDAEIALLKKAFLDHQVHFFTSAKGIEGKSSKHYTFAPEGTGDSYFIHQRKLGQGSYGSVDKVISKLSLESYARKRVLRGRGKIAADCQLSIVNELQALRRLKHAHLVETIGSYTDREYIAYLMLPVAQNTLSEFLGESKPLGPHHKAPIRHFYGCLTGALHYLHENKIRHRDLSAKNILVHNDEVYISDFGSAYSWTNASGGMTRHRSTPVSPDYMAPEIARDENHDKASDMWSLGIIFLEMTTRLLGHSLKGYKDAISNHARNNKARPHAYANVPVLRDWLDFLSKVDTEFDHDKEPLSWTPSLLHFQQEQRPTTRMLMREIMESPSFDAFCCFKCKDAYHGDCDSAIIHDRAPSYTTEFNTFSAVQSMLESTGDDTPFGGLSNNRMGSIKAWAASVEPAPSAEFDSDGSDMGQYGSRRFDVRYSSQAIYGNYEADLFAPTSTQDPSAHLETEEAPEPDASINSFEALRRMQTSRQVAEDLGEPEIPRNQGYVDEHLEDFGLGFLERESASSSDERSMKPFDEVSDCSTADSDLGSCTGINGINGRLQAIIEEDESFNIDSMDLDGLSQDSMDNSEQEQSQGLGFDEASDHSDSESHSIKSVGVKVPRRGNDPDLVVPVKQTVETVLPLPHLQPNRGPEVPPSQNQSGLPQASEILAKVEQPSSEPNPNKVPTCCTTSHGGHIEPDKSTPVSSKTETQDRKLHELKAIEVRASDTQTGGGQTGEVQPGDIQASKSQEKQGQESKVRKRKAFKPKEAKPKGSLENDIQESGEVQQPIREAFQDDKVTETPQVKVLRPAPKYQRPKSGGYKKPKSESVTEHEARDVEAQRLETHKDRKDGRIGDSIRPNPISLSGSSSRQATGEKESVLETASENAASEDVKVQGIESLKFPKNDNKRKSRVDANFLPSQKSVNKKAVRFDNDYVIPRVPRGNYPPEATDGISRQEDGFAPIPQTSQTSNARHNLSKHNLGQLNEDNKNSRIARDPKPRESCTGVDVVKLMSQSWDKASSAPTSNMSEATRSKLSVALFSFASPRDIIAILNNHCKDGKAKAVKVILQHQTQSRAQKAKYHGPLWSAVKGASQRHNKCVRELIGAEVDVNITSKRTGKSPLHVAVEHDNFKGYISLIWLLINANAKLDALDSDGDSPMIKLFLANDHEPLAQHRRDALALLLHAGARVDISQPATGITPLHLAVRRQDKWAVAMLLSKGADVNAKTSSGTTPLQITANQFRGDLSPDHAEVLYILLQHEGVRVDEPAGAMKRTALHLAVISGTAHAVEMLMQHGASTKTKDNDEHNAMMLAVQHATKLTNDTSKTLDRRLNDHVEIMRLLTAKEYKWPSPEPRCAVEVACTSNGTKLLERLFRRKLNPKDKFGEHGTILDFASKHGSPVVQASLSCFSAPEG